jgi:hypothetical protein
LGAGFEVKNYGILKVIFLKTVTKKEKMKTTYWISILGGEFVT